MSEVTVRDRVWDAVLRLGDGGEVFRTGEVLESANLTESQRRTARRTLRSMERLGWIEQVELHSNRWVVSDGSVVSDSGESCLEKGESDDGDGVERFEGMGVSAALSEVTVGDVLDVVIDRRGDAGHFIAYPVGCDFEGWKDGIHLDLPDNLDDRVERALWEENVRLVAEVEIVEVDGYPLAVPADLEDTFGDEFDSFGGDDLDEGDGGGMFCDECGSLMRKEDELMVCRSCGSRRSVEDDFADQFTFEETDFENEVEVGLGALVEYGKDWRSAVNRTHRG